MKIPRLTFVLLIAIAAVTVSGTSFAQTLIGSTGAGWQTWNVTTDQFGDFIDLNSNGAPYWDVPFLTFNAGGWGQSRK